MDGTLWAVTENIERFGPKVYKLPNDVIITITNNVSYTGHRVSKLIRSEHCEFKRESLQLGYSDLPIFKDCDRYIIVKFRKQWKWIFWDFEQQAFSEKCIIVNNEIHFEILKQMYGTRAPLQITLAGGTYFKSISLCTVPTFFL